MPADVDNAELLTARLSLRRPVRDDIHVILEIYADPRSSLHNPSDALTSRSEAEQLFERWNEHWQRLGYGYWVVRRRDSGKVVGFCGVKSMNFRARRVLNLFYRLHPSAWGKGLASEAALAVVEWARAHVPEVPIVARVRPANVASQRVAARVGLVREAALDEPGDDGLDWIFVEGWRSL